MRGSDAFAEDVLRQTGLRPSDLAAMRVSDVDTASSRVTVGRMKGRQMVGVPQSTAVELARRLADGWGVRFRRNGHNHNRNGGGQ